MINAGEIIDCGTIKSYDNEDFGDALSKVMPKIIFLGNEEQSDEKLEKVINKYDNEDRQKFLKFFRKRTHCTVQELLV